MPSQHEIVLFQSSDQTISLPVDFDGETAWLSQAQMAELFEKDQSVISRHIRNAFSEGEIDRESNMQFMHIASSDKPIALLAPSTRGSAAWKSILQLRRKRRTCCISS